MLVAVTLSTLLMQGRAVAAEPQDFWCTAWVNLHIEDGSGQKGDGSVPKGAGSGALKFGPGLLLLYDHASGKAFVVREKKCTQLEPAGNLRIRAGVKLRVVVANTNTALYGFTLTQGSVAAEEISTLQGFSKALGPYLSELGREAFGRAVAPPPTGPAVKTATPLDVIRAQLYGKEGLEHSTAIIASALERMRAFPPDPAVSRRTLDDATRAVEKGDTSLDDDTATLKKELVDTGVFKVAGDRYTLTTIGKLTLAFKMLAEQGAPSTEERTVLGGQETVLEAAYRVQALGQAALTAKNVWYCSDPLTVSYEKGRKLTLKVAPAAPPELSRLASLGPQEFTTTVNPDWLVRPALGLAFLTASGATYPKYGTKKAGDEVEVVQNAMQDSRFTYGLTLGLTWRGLDWRDNNGWAVWAPELVVNPSTDVKAAGFGAAVSWKILKLGVGKFWTKHTALDGQVVGQHLPDADSLKTRDVYGRGEWYVSISVIGWAPFVQ